MSSSPPAKPLGARAFVRRTWAAVARSRVLAILLPIHLVAFGLLYLSTRHVVRGEMLHTHATDARLLLDEALDGLHPYMCLGTDRDVPTLIGEWQQSHHMLGLQVYRRDGRPIGGIGDPDPEMARFLESTADDRFAFDDRGDRVVLEGRTRITSKGRCTECHEAGALLGAATLRLDLTREVVAAHRRLDRSLGALIIAWGVVAGIVNVSLGTLARRSVRRLEQRASAPAGAEPHGTSPVHVPLDPVSTEILDSLQRALSRQHRLDEHLEARLQHAERLASLGQLAAGLAHEIKNPLAGIHGVLELMRDDDADSPNREVYEQMLAELDRVNGTIHALLSFARPAPPRRTSTDVRGLLEESVQLLRPRLQQRAIAIDLEVAPSVERFDLDRNQVRQVIVNLVANAADAIEHDGLVSIRATGLPQPGGLVLAVVDDGPGIPEGELEHVFEPFYTTKFTGTGLGLAVVRSLVEAQGGRVEVTSELGRGAAFFVILPTAGTTGIAEG